MMRTMFGSISLIPFLSGLPLNPLHFRAGCPPTLLEQGRRIVSRRSEDPLYCRTIRFPHHPTASKPRSAVPPGDQMLLIIGIIWRTTMTAIGPTVTTNNDGRMQKKMGNTSFTPSFAAFSSAICRA